MYKWKKLGQLYKSEYINERLKTHASNPIAVKLYDNVYRVYFSGRDSDNKSSVGYVDVDIISFKVMDICEEETFACSNEHDGFYSHGVSIGCMYSSNGRNFLLFMAWQIKNNEHWRGDIGRLEVSDDLKKMSVVGGGPFLSCDNEDLVSLSYPWVLYDDVEGIYKMWYGSTVTWNAINGEMIHVIKYASSHDGENWLRHGIAVPYEIGQAQAFSRPTIMKDAEGYHMWYSYRSGTGQKYRIGYSHSFDGINWSRQSNPGIDVSATGWDSEMICYPFVFEHNGDHYMLYNGNDFGREGFGLAILEK